MLIRESLCKFCKKGRLIYDPQLTFEKYSEPEAFVLDDVDKLVDGIIGDYLVYRCEECGAAESYTFKDIEKMARKRISERVIDLKARGAMIETGVLLAKRRIMIYCGKCNGFDGKGSCLLETFKNCELKRLIHEL
jgi:hypothetical protein